MQAGDPQGVVGPAARADDDDHGVAGLEVDAPGRAAEVDDLHLHPVLGAHHAQAAAHDPGGVLGQVGRDVDAEAEVLPRVLGLAREQPGSDGHADRRDVAAVVAVVAHLREHREAGVVERLGAVATPLAEERREPTGGASGAGGGPGRRGITVAPLVARAVGAGPLGAGGGGEVRRRGARDGRGGRDGHPAGAGVPAGTPRATHLREVRRGDAHEQTAHAPGEHVRRSREGRALRGAGGLARHRARVDDGLLEAHALEHELPAAVAVGVGLLLEGGEARVVGAPALDGELLRLLEVDLGGRLGPGLGAAGGVVGPGEHHVVAALLDGDGEPVLDVLQVHAVPDLLGDSATHRVGAGQRHLVVRPQRVGGEVPDGDEPAAHADGGLGVVLRGGRRRHGGAEQQADHETDDDVGPVPADGAGQARRAPEPGVGPGRRGGLGVVMHGSSPFWWASGRERDAGARRRRRERGG